MAIEHEEFYEQVAAEIDAERIKPGLWAMAFSEAVGDEIRAAMQTAGVNRIDHFVLTHYHEDHMGGIDDLTTSPVIPIGTAHDRGDKSFLTQKKLDEKTYKDYQTAAGASANHLTRGESIALDPLMTVTCVASG